MQPELMNQRALSDPKASLEDLLHEGTVALGLDLHQACRDKLLAYLNLMIKWNAVFNLTAIRDPRQMLIQHLLDSLSGIPVLRRHLDLDHAELAVLARTGGRGFPAPDGYIAAIAASRGFMVVSRDAAPYEAARVQVINPWEAVS